MKEIKTWANGSKFQYAGNISEGTILHFGKQFQNSETVSANHYRMLLAKFQKRTVPIGTSQTDPEEGSVGAWLKANVCSRGIASYVGRILVEEGYADRHGSNISFK